MIAAVEDVLSEAVVLSGVLRKNGREYIRSRARELNRTAHSVPVLVVVDLDRPVPCPADLIESWLPSPRAPMLLFRLAVMEIEAWVMADRESFAAFLSVPMHRIPANPDEILQPKELIVSVAKRSKSRDIREDLAPSTGDTRRVGPAFNARLTAYVADTWNPAAAAASSPSLRRATERLRSS